MQRRKQRKIIGLIWVLLIVGGFGWSQLSSRQIGASGSTKNSNAFGQIVELMNIQRNHDLTLFPGHEYGPNRTQVLILYNRRLHTVRCWINGRFQWIEFFVSDNEVREAATRFDAASEFPKHRGVRHYLTLLFQISRLLLFAGLIYLTVRVFLPVRKPSRL